MEPGSMYMLSHMLGGLFPFLFILALFWLRSGRRGRMRGYGGYGAYGRQIQDLQRELDQTREQLRQSEEQLRQRNDGILLLERQNEQLRRDLEWHTRLLTTPPSVPPPAAVEEARPSAGSPG